MVEVASNSVGYRGSSGLIVSGAVVMMVGESAAVVSALVVVSVEVGAALDVVEVVFADAVVASSLTCFSFACRASIKSGNGRGPSTIVLWYRRRASRYCPKGKTTPR
jgi:hypothetical protein